MKIQKQQNSNARYFAPRQIEIRNLQEEKNKKLREQQIL
jgi:hypothetical protein